MHEASYTMRFARVGPHMKTIAFSADEQFIEAACEQAAADHSTLNDQFRLWLEQYVQHGQRIEGLRIENPFRK